MTIRLPNDGERDISAEVVRGYFASVDDALLEARRSFQRQRQTPATAPGLGLMGDLRHDAELLGRAVGHAMKVREERPWRLGSGEWGGSRHGHPFRNRQGNRPSRCRKRPDSSATAWISHAHGDFRDGSRPGLSASRRIEPNPGLSKRRFLRKKSSFLTKPPPTSRDRSPVTLIESAGRSAVATR